MRTGRVLAAVLATALSWFPLGARAAPPPLGRSEFLALAERLTDPAKVAAIVRERCVDFDIDAATLAELCPRVPPEALLAAIECRLARSGAAPARPAQPAAAPAAAPVPAPVAAPAPPPPERAAPPVEPPAAVNADDAFLRLAAPAVKSGCYLFVDYKGPVTRLRLRGTVTSGLKPGNWESEFRGEQYWWLPPTAASGSGFAAVVPAGRHSLTIYCDAGWYRNGITADLTAGRTHSLVVKSGGGDDLAIEGVRLEPADAPIPSSRERAYPAVAR